MGEVTGNAYADPDRAADDLAPPRADVDPVGTDPLPVESVAEVLARSGFLCGCERADCPDVQEAAAELQPLIDTKVVEAVREALDEVIEAHAERFGPAGSASRMWLRERRAALEQP
jgi:hypothetical protein